MGLSPREGKEKRHSMAEIKFRRLSELSIRLKEDHDRPRIKVSEASGDLINYCKSTKDHMIPSIWGALDKREDPYAPQQSGSGSNCCILM